MAHQTSSNMNFSTIIKAVCCTAIIGFSHLVPANGAAIRGADDSRVPTRAPSIKPSITISDHTEMNDFDTIGTTNDDQRINNNDIAPLLTQDSANLVDELAQQRERKLLTRKRNNKNDNANSNKQKSKNKNIKATKPKQPNDGSPTPSPTSAYVEVLDLSIPPDLNDCLLRALPTRSRKKKFVKGGNTQKGKNITGNGQGQGKKGQGKNKNNRSLQGRDSEGFDYTGANELRSFILKYNGMDDDDSDSDDENYFVDDDDNTKSKNTYNNLLFGDDDDDDEMDMETYEEIRRRLQSVTSDYNRAAINACLIPHLPDREKICTATSSPTLKPTVKPQPTCPDRNPPQCPNNVVCLPGQDTLDPITGCPCECDCPYNPVPKCPPTTVCTPDELFHGTGDGCPCVCAPPGKGKGKGKGKGNYVGKGKGYHVGKGKGNYGKGSKGSKGGYYYYNYAALAKENSFDSRVVRLVRKAMCQQSAVPSQFPSESPTAEPTPRPTANPTMTPTEPAITTRPSPRPTQRTPRPTEQATRLPTCPVPYPDCPDRVTCDLNSIVTDPDTNCPCFCKKEPGKGKGKGHYAKGGGAKGQYAKGVGKGAGKGYGGKYQKKTKKGSLNPGRTKQPKASRTSGMAALEGDGSEHPSLSPLPNSLAESGEAELAELASSETVSRQRKRKKKSLQGEESVDSEDGSTITLRYLLQYLEEEDEKRESRGTKLRGRASSLNENK